jgi:hypothetical protein
MQPNWPTFENINPFIFIRNKHRDISSEGYAAHPVRYKNQLQIKMAVRNIFFQFELTELCVAARRRQ